MLENSDGTPSDKIFISPHNDIEDNKENRGFSEITEEKTVQCKTKRVLTLLINAKPSDTGKTKTWAEAPDTSKRTDSPTGQRGPDIDDDTPRTPTRMLMVHDTRMLHDHDFSTLHVQEAAMLHVQEAATPERPGRPSVPTPGKYGTGYGGAPSPGPAPCPAFLPPGFLPPTPPATSKLSKNSSAGMMRKKCLENILNSVAVRQEEDEQDVKKIRLVDPDDQVLD